MERTLIPKFSALLLFIVVEAGAQGLPWPSNNIANLALFIHTNNPLSAQQLLPVSTNVANLGTYAIGVSNIANALAVYAVAASNANAVATMAQAANTVTNIQFVITNYPLNTVFTNGSRPIIYMPNYSLRATNVTGMAAFAVVTDWNGSGTYSNRYRAEFGTTSGSITNAGSLICFIPASARFYSTNASVGNGNSASVLFGLRQQL